MELEVIFKAEFMGEIKGLNQALDLINECVVFSETDKKNYVDGDKFIQAINNRKSMLFRRQTKHSYETGKHL